MIEPRSHPGAPEISRARGLIALAVMVGLALRVWEAAGSSLWLDELHTLFHASLPTAKQVAASVSQENHTPLFFVFVHWFGAWEHGAALRAIPVLSSLLVFAPLIAFARRAQFDGFEIALAALSFACWPYALHYSTELRPYAWLMLFSAGAAWSAFREDGSQVASFVLFAVCVGLGMATHYLMAVAVFSIGVARLFVRSRKMLHLGWLVLAGAIAVAPTVPWLLDFARGATEKRFEYQESVGGYHLRAQLVKEFVALPTRLFVPYVGALGGAWAWMAKFGAIVLFGSLFSALVSWLLRRKSPDLATSAPMRALAIFCAADFVLVAALSLYTWDRLPLQYYAPIAWALPLFAVQLGRAFDAQRRPKYVVALTVSALLLGLAQAGGKCTEDMRAAVAIARETGRELASPQYTAILSQPSLFDDVIPYRAYGRDLEMVERSDASPARPLVVIQRGRMPHDTDDWKALLAGRKIAREVPVDAYLTVYVLEPAP
jgi:hypothetical protein